MNNSLTTGQFLLGWFTKTLAITAMMTASVTLNIGGRDVWLSAIIGYVIGLISFAILVQLVSKFPKENISQWSTKIFGNFLGRIITVLYILSFLSYCTLSAEEYGDIMTSAIVSENPERLYYSLLLIPAIYAAWLGISVVYRLNQVFVPLVVFSSFLIAFLNYPSMDFSNYLPLLDNGIMPVLEASIVLGSRFTFITIIFALYPLITDKQKNMIKPGLGISALACSIILLILNSISLYGIEYASKMHFIILENTRNITVSNALSKLDFLIILIWMIGAFAFISVFLYGASVLTRDLLRLKSYKFILLIYGLLVLIFDIFFKPSIVQLKELIGLPVSIAMLGLNVVLPFLMLLVVIVKKPQ